ncbi:tetratricopeptide repeat protein, partial [Klebsiella pneumoniae]|uniref:tetratricopeptide repeat protein n=1 Tax=Klebsiella pneumoniae TaxID=573 RepID=UPI0030133E16
QLEKALGRLLATKGRYSEASDLLARASHKLALDAELRYYLGLSLASLGKPDEARESWKISAPDREFGPPSVFEMAALEARAGHGAPALALVKQALD